MAKATPYQANGIAFKQQAHNCVFAQVYKQYVHVCAKPTATAIHINAQCTMNCSVMHVS